MHIGNISFHDFIQAKKYNEIDGKIHMHTYRVNLKHIYISVLMNRKRIYIWVVGYINWKRIYFGAHKWEMHLYLGCIISIDSNESLRATFFICNGFRIGNAFLFGRC